MNDVTKLPGKGNVFEEELYKAIDEVLSSARSPINVTATEARSKVEKKLGISLPWPDKHWGGIYPKFRERFIAKGTCVPRAHKGRAAAATVAPKGEAPKVKITRISETRVEQKIVLDDGHYRTLVAVIRNDGLSSTCNIVIDNLLIERDLDGCIRFLQAIKEEALERR